MMLYITVAVLSIVLYFLYLCWYTKKSIDDIFVTMMGVSLIVAAWPYTYPLLLLGFWIHRITTKLMSMRKK